MRLRLFAAAALIAVASSSLPAQVGGGPAGGPDLSQLSPEEATAVQELQEAAMQMMQRIQEKGIDTQSFAQDIMQQMQDPAFDAETFQQKLIDQGILDAELVRKFQKSIQAATLAAIRRQLNATDEEWTVLLPKLQRVVAAMSDAGKLTQGAVMRGGGGMGGGLAMMGRASPEMSQAVKKLRDSFKDKNASPAAVATCLLEYRTLRNKALAMLHDAQEDLRGVVTVRQEAVLMQFDILP